MDKEKKKMAVVATKKPGKPQKLAHAFGLSKEKDFFLENLSMLLDAGMDLIYGLNALEADTKNKSMRKIIQTIRAEISAGSALWRAMDMVKLLPAQMLYLVRLGEETGRLPENLDVIVKQQEKQKLYGSKVRSAMIYPVLVITLATVVGTGVAWFVLPTLTNVFKQLDLALPPITKGVIAISDFLQTYGYYAVPSAFAAIGVLVYFVFVFKKTKFIGQALLLHLPVIKNLMIQVELARFGFVLGTLLKAGLPITKALESLQNSTSLHRYVKFYQYLYQNVAAGQSFENSFRAYKKIDSLMEPHIQQMIVAGEKSGALPNTLLRIGARFELKVDETTQNLSVLLEPFMLVIVWIFVLLLALAVIIPIYSLVGNISGQIK
jgi:type II secretory pathway component PulF